MFTWRETARLRRRALAEQYPRYLGRWMIVWSTIFAGILLMQVLSALLTGNPRWYRGLTAVLFAVVVGAGLRIIAELFSRRIFVARDNCTVSWMHPTMQGRAE